MVDFSELASELERRIQGIREKLGSDLVLFENFSKVDNFATIWS